MKDVPERREYVAEDFHWMRAYNVYLVSFLSTLMDEPGEIGDDMTYFLYLMQVGHEHEAGELDD